MCSSNYFDSSLISHLSLYYLCDYTVLFKPIQNQRKAFQASEKMRTTRSLLTGLTPESLDVLSNYSVIQPPAGISSDFLNPKTQNQPLLGVTSLLLGIMGIFFLNRVYTKSFIVRKYSWDDLTLTFGVVGSITYYVAFIWGAQKGKLGAHFWDVSIAEISSLDLLIPSYLVIVLTSPTMMFIKVTFFFLYLQNFQPKRWLRISAFVGAVFTLWFYLAMTIALFISSSPRHGETWLSHMAQPDQLSLDVAVPQAVVGLAIDIYILVLPIIAVSQLNLPKRQKIGVILIFMTGLLACLSSLLSMYYRNILLRSKDVTWALMPVITVTLVEMFVGIICACTPAAAQSCRHNLPSYDTLKSLLLSHSHALRSSFKGTLSASSSVGFKDIELSQQQHRDPDRSHESYSNVDHYQSPLEADMAQNQENECIIIRGGRQHKVEISHV